ncbi:MAG: glycine radical domain-containing protein, partial [Anaerolineae bacterium]|nr:glycine radical domain-containing protein [Anaerolineae bacterium]
DMALFGQTLQGTEEMRKFESLIKAFLDLKCTATLQMNIIDRETLLKARANPHDPAYQTLIVRVWGFSAVFVELPLGLQDHVLARTEHVI